MKEIKLRNLTIENFKGISHTSISFNDSITNICGANGTGKTTVNDAWSWLLYDRNSTGDSKFAIRKLDADGSPVHHTDISVTGTISVDGTEFTLQKVQRERWVKKRGQSEQEYSGNTNEFSINGYPKSSAEFTKFVADIVDENIFKILTSPYTFPQMDWKDQRKLLFSLIGDLDTSDLESEVEYFDLIKDELAIASIDDIRKKWVKSKNTLSKLPDEIQTRIDEVSKQIKEVDVPTLEKEKAEVENTIQMLEAKVAELSQKNNSDIENSILQLKSQQIAIADRVRNAMCSDLTKRKSVSDKLEVEYQNENKKYIRLSNEVELYESEIDKLKKLLTEQLESYNKLKDQQFPDGKTKCPTCGQLLPENEIKSLKEKWQSEQNTLINNLRITGNKLAVDIKNKEIKLRDKTELLEKQKDKADKAKIKYEVAANDLEYQGETIIPKMSDIPECQEIDKQIAELESQKIDLAKIRIEIDRLKQQVSEEKYKLSAINNELYASKQNTECEKRIQELQEELRGVSQKIADCEKVLYAVENYVKAISKRINDRFDGLNFLLFKNQVNGGVAECCEITYRGVPYSSLNSGHRITVGLNIIKTLHEYYQTTVPVWIDNAECLSGDNQPNIDSQLILLKVTNDSQLSVE